MQTYPPDVSITSTEKSVRNRQIERSVARYDLEGGKFIRISVGGDMDTEEALEWAEELIRFKRKELERKARRPVSVMPEPERIAPPEDIDKNA